MADKTIAQLPLLSNSDLDVRNDNLLILDSSTDITKKIAPSGIPVTGFQGAGTAVTRDVGISNTNLLQAKSGVSDNDFLRIDGTSVEGRSASEVISDLGLSTAASLATGISNTNVLVANANVSDNDFLKIDGVNVEGRSASEVKSDLNLGTVVDLNTGISNTNILVSNGGMEDGDFLKVMGVNVSGVSSAEMLSGFGLGNIATLATGVSANNLLPVATGGLLASDGLNHFLTVSDGAMESFTIAQTRKELGLQSEVGNTGFFVSGSATSIGNLDKILLQADNSIDIQIAHTGSNSFAKGEGDLMLGASNISEDIAISGQAFPGIGVTRTDNVVSVITQKSHGFDTGDVITVENFDDSSFNVSNVAVTKVNSTRYTYAANGSNGSASGSVGRAILINKGAVCIGRENSAKSRSHIAIGFKNSCIGGKGILTIGSNNVVISTIGSDSIEAKMTVIGSSNTVTASNSYGGKGLVLGNDNVANVITQDNPSLCVGNDNTYLGGTMVGINNNGGAGVDKPIIMGADNTSSSSYGLVIFGKNNTNTGSYNPMMFGTANTNSGSYNCMTLGSSCVVSANYSQAIGIKSKTSVANTMEIGLWRSVNSRTSGNNGATIRLNKSIARVSMTMTNSSSAPADQSTSGAETDAQLGREMYTIQRNSNAVTLFVNVGGTIKSLSLGNLS